MVRERRKTPVLNRLGPHMFHGKERFESIPLSTRLYLPLSIYNLNGWTVIIVPYD